MADQSSITSELNLNKLPKHIAIIMDGNGRWAKKHGKNRLSGHKSGANAVRKVTEACAELGIKYLTLYAFSTENWKRPKREINALMTLLVSTLKKETAQLNKNNIRLKAIGKLESLPKNCYRELTTTIEKTKNNDRMTLILALSYSARWEITEMVKKIQYDIKNGKLNTEDITTDVIHQYLDTAGIPDPDLLIRTSGENRISNFLLWQIAYTELYFCKTFWPSFEKKDLYEALIDYQQRERRYGLTSEQMK